MFDKNKSQGINTMFVYSEMGVLYLISTFVLQSMLQSCAITKNLCHMDIYIGYETTENSVWGKGDHKYMNEHNDVPIGGSRNVLCMCCTVYG